MVKRLELQADCGLYCTPVELTGKYELSVGHQDSQDHGWHGSHCLGSQTIPDFGQYLVAVWTSGGEGERT